MKITYNIQQNQNINRKTNNNNNNNLRTSAAVIPADTIAPMSYMLIRAANENPSKPEGAMVDASTETGKRAILPVKEIRTLSMIMKLDLESPKV